jgi:hypothetical protein
MPWTIADVDKHKKGLSPKGKRQWVKVANSVLSKCMADGGEEATCAASAIRQANGVTGNEGSSYSAYFTIQDNSYNIRTENHQGKKHIVVPVIMMVEGVHNGSRGPLLHRAEDLGKIPESWNGIPITVQHPEMNGSLVSANRPDIIDKAVVGRIYNTRFEEGKLKAEAWLDEDKLQQNSAIALAYIRNQRPLEVSVGVFTEDEMTTGLWNGETYDAIARNHRPDHLALLPGCSGACSWADGCGIRANKQNTNEEGGEVMSELEDAICLIVEKGGFVSNILINGELGLRDRLSAIQSKLDSMDTLQKSHYLQEVYEDYVIYEIVARGGGDVPAVAGGELYKQDYTISDNGEVELTGDAVQVKKKIEYVAMVATQQLTNKSGGKNMPEEKKTPCCPEKVDLLIQSEKTPWKEGDREWLNTLECSQIDKIVGMSGKEKEDDPPKPVTKEEALQVLHDQLSDPEKFLKIIPSDMAEQMRHGLALHKEEKQKLVTMIMDNSKDFTAEELNAKPIDELKKLTSLIKPVADYSARGNGGTNQSVDNLLPPMGVEIEKK